jgi:hypothetical protein
MGTDDLEATVRRFASDRRLLLLMCDLMTKYGEFDRAGIASQYGPRAPRNLKRYRDAGLIENESRPKGSGRIYYAMPRHIEIREILESQQAED